LRWNYSAASASRSFLILGAHLIVNCKY